MARWRSWRSAVLVAAVVVIGGAGLIAPRISQPLDYHRFADDRACLGIPNCLNVVSNVPFAIVGLMGVAAALSRTWRLGAADGWDRQPYVALFAGVALTSLGSSY